MQDDEIKVGSIISNCSGTYLVHEVLIQGDDNMNYAFFRSNQNNGMYGECTFSEIGPNKPFQLEKS